jgi:hypothetical protein
MHTIDFVLEKLSKKYGEGITFLKHDKPELQFFITLNPRNLPQFAKYLWMYVNS